MQRNRAETSAKERAYGIWAMLICLLLVHLPAFAGEASPKAAKEKAKESERGIFGGNKKDPIFITSDRMEVDQKKNTITYLGRVVTQQGEMTMKSEQLTAYYTAEMKEIKEVVAEGQVNVTQGDRVATGAKAVFSDKEQTITLTGNPVVRQGNSQVSGTRITFFVEQDRAVVEGGNQRVKATILPEELQKRDKGEAGTSKGR